MKISKIVGATAITALAAVACITAGTKEASAKKAENVILDETNVKVKGGSQEMYLKFEAGPPEKTSMNGYPITGVQECVGGGTTQERLCLV